MRALDVLERARAAAYDAWQANMTPESEAALARADDALRRARRAQYATDGVTLAGQRETQFRDDESEDAC